MKTELVYKGVQLIAERRQRKRCPNCQFLLALVLVLVFSLVLLLFFNLWPRLSPSGQFQISSAKTYDMNESIVIDADLKMNFSKEVVEALENGIPLTIAVEVQIFRERPWWRNIVIKESMQLFELRYHPLTDVHEVKNLATQERYSFKSREDAMAVLGTIRAAHLIDKKMLNKNDQYHVQIHTLLDISRLPPALRQIASLSSSWRLESPWYQLAVNSDKKHNKESVGEQK